ncbi:uncharacterized protein LOC142578072 isoform X2 [Dermacentor variabilis]|uniref:uncharacterized protein LOC142578072 isoform X2 n=1 Tax=Dermacentor variabilis TaxID=34621 RepID=UPI003F5C5EAF
MQHVNFAVLLALFTVANAVSFDDLYTALNTTQNIWLKQRSYQHDNHTCVYVSKVFLNETDYKFKQHYKEAETQHNTTRFAKLGGKNETYPWMTVSSEQGQPGLNYTLEFANKNETCGVLTLDYSECEAREVARHIYHIWVDRHRTRGQKQCEMYVWDEHVNDTLTECEKGYRNLCNVSYTVYTSECKAESG